MSDGMTTELLARVAELAARGALFVSNNSGGKDSQAMLITLARLVPREQILSLHASLGEDGTDVDGVEWPDTLAWVERMSAAVGVRVATTRAGKSLFDMVERSAARLIAQGKYETASPWPSPKYRQCTSDLKRGPLERAIRAHVKAHRLPGIVVNCMGLRAEESTNRARAEVWARKPDKEAARGAVQEWYDWLPLHGLSTAEVFATIRDAGQEPHWAYARGMTRLSCCFCIMASPADLTTAAKLRPALYARYVRTEQRLHKTLHMGGKGLEEVTGVRLHVITNKENGT